MPMISLTDTSKKAAVMQDTWGHLYPVPGRKYPGHVLIAVGDFTSTAISSDFPQLEYSPQRAALMDELMREKKICNLPEGLHYVSCTFWFFKSEDDYKKQYYCPGKVIKIKTKNITNMIKGYFPCQNDL